MCNVGNDSDDDFALEGRFPIHNPNPTVDEVQMAMEEIVEKEKDLKQLAQVTNMLFSRNKELQKQWEE